jgi:hypothetical protein
MAGTKRAARSKGRSVPAALAKRAEKLAAAKRRELAEQARKDIALIKEKHQTVQAAFFEIGQALVRLSEPMVARALGYASFKELVAKEVGMALETAERFKRMAKLLHEADAIEWGADKAHAVAELVEAAGLPRLPPGGRLEIGKNRTIDVRAAEANAIEAVAKELRQAKHARGRPSRGRTTTAEERAMVKALEAAAKKGGIEGGKFECLATAPGKPADVRMRVAITALADLARALAAVARDHRRR